MTLGLRARRVVFGLVLVAMCVACAYYLRTTATPTAPLRFLSDEVIEEEERDLLRDLRTSFVPRDARYADVADYLGPQEPRASRKVKRDRQGAEISHDKNSEVLPFSNKVSEYSRDGINIAEVTKSSVPNFNKNSSSYDYEEYYEDDGRWELRSVEDESRYQNNFGPHPSMGENGGALSGRGPLNVEVDLRSMPEIEEAEIPSDLVGNSETLDIEPSGIRALWTDQGDARKIRRTQADIMKQYMDWTADPCDNFYQYSCGNWAQVNPIPPDKAGFDTFEMLRENLDTVLREILTLKNNKFCDEYPGPNLDLGNDIVFYSTTTTEFSTTPIRSSLESAVNEDLVEFGQVLSSPNPLNDVYQTTLATNIIIDTERKERSTSANNNSTLHEITNNNRMHPVKVEKDSEQDKYDIIVDHTQESVYNLNNTKKDEYSPKALERSMLNIEEHRSPKNQDIRTHFKRSIPFNKEDDIEKEAKIKEENSADVDAEMKVRYLFESCMNHDILRKRGHQPLLDLLGMFGGWPVLNPDWDASDFDWLEIMAKLRLYNNDILISEWVGPDIMNSDEFVIQLDQTSLGLPTRDYFLQNSNKAYLDGYKKYILKVATLLGSSLENAEQGANEIILFETSLSQKYSFLKKVSNPAFIVSIITSLSQRQESDYTFCMLAGIVSSPEERRNVSMLYQRVTVRDLTNLVPQICWQKYLSIVLNRPTELNESVVIFALKYVQNLVTLVSETEPKIIANYLLWRFIRHRVNNLDDRFQEAKQQFYYVLYGREQAPLRWKNCVSQVNANMGMAMGSMFVRKYFDENSKNDTLTMTREIQESFMEMLNLTTWIDDETKSLAMEKVETMMLRIGYPDFILDKKELNDRYKELKIHPNKYFENTLNILQYLNKIEQSRLGQPVNKTLWNTAPAVVNAYYSRNKNQIMFPAGILQPPFYHRHFPKSLNYGGIGVVIGHEITHGFDDKGRLFDNNGNLHKWWKSLAIEAFHERAQCLIDQYSNYTVSEVSMEIDGFNTQGENIADNGGIKQAFAAYHRWQAENPSADEILPGLNLTSNQLFFLNFAQVWCGAMRPEALKNKLKTTVHSPGKFRVIGTLSNFDEFAKEFNCPEGSRMNPDTKCRVW